MEGCRRGNSFQTETRTHLRMSWKSVGIAVTAFHQISIFARSQPSSRTPSPTSSILKKSSATMTRGESLNAVKRPTAKTVKRPKSMVEKSCRSKDGDGPSLVWAARCFLFIDLVQLSWDGGDIIFHANNFSCKFSLYLQTKNNYSGKFSHNTDSKYIK